MDHVDPRRVAVALSFSGCFPGVARADALDAMWIVAVPVIAVWAAFALGALTTTWHAARGGSRAGTLVGLVGVWLAVAPPILIALGDGLLGYGGNILWGSALWVVIPGGAAATMTWLAIRTLGRVRMGNPPEAP